MKLESSARQGGETPAELAAMAKTLYAGERLLPRKMQQVRPHICPFDRLLPYISPALAVLDVGCGCGLLLGLLVKRGSPIQGVGLDISAGAIEIANRMAGRLRQQGLPGSLVFRQVRPQDSWPAGPFDVVCLIDIIHHIPPSSQKSVLRMAAERVRPGGLLIYKDIAERPLWRALANRLHDLVMARQWIWYLRRQTVESQVRECALDLVHAERINVLWYAHDLLVFRRPEAP